MASRDEHYFKHSHRKDGTVQTTCTRCDVKSPVFDELAEMALLIAWCNTHSQEGTNERDKMDT